MLNFNHLSAFYRVSLDKVFVVIRKLSCRFSALISDKPFLTLSDRYCSPQRDSNLGPLVATISRKIACHLKPLGHHDQFTKMCQNCKKCLILINSTLNNTYIFSEPSVLTRFHKERTITNILVSFW